MENAFTGNLCAFNFDGSEFRQVTEEFAGLEVTEDFDMNEFGQIAFVCRTTDVPNMPVADSNEVCVINLDGSGFAKLTAANSRVENLHITEVGQIVYECSVEGSFRFLFR